MWCVLSPHLARNVKLSEAIVSEDTVRPLSSGLCRFNFHVEITNYYRHVELTFQESFAFLKHKVLFDCSIKILSFNLLKSYKFSHFFPRILMCKIYVSCNKTLKWFRRKNGENRFPRKMAKIPKNILDKIQKCPIACIVCNLWVCQLTWKKNDI